MLPAVASNHEQALRARAVEGRSDNLLNLRRRPRSAFEPRFAGSADDVVEPRPLGRRQPVAHGNHSPQHGASDKSAADAARYRCHDHQPHAALAVQQ